MVNISVEFRQHAQASKNCEAEEMEETTVETNETENINAILSFSQAIAIITNILYKREKKEKKPPLYSFDEFRTTMEGEDVRLKSFFDELYLSTNPSSKNKDSQTQVKGQLLFICYFFCGIRNKFVNYARRDLTVYLDSTGTSNATIDTLADLGVTTTSHTVT